MILKPVVFEFEDETPEDADKRARRLASCIKTIPSFHPTKKTGAYEGVLAECCPTPGQKLDLMELVQPGTAA